MLCASEDMTQIGCGLTIALLIILIIQYLILSNDFSVLQESDRRRRSRTDHVAVAFVAITNMRSAINSADQ